MMEHLPVEGGEIDGHALSRLSPFYSSVTKKELGIEFTAIYMGMKCAFIQEMGGQALGYVEKSRSVGLQ